MAVRPSLGFVRTRLLLSPAVSRAGRGGEITCARAALARIFGNEAAAMICSDRNGRAPSRVSIIAM